MPKSMLILTIEHLDGDARLPIVINALESHVKYLREEYNSFSEASHTFKTKHGVDREGFHMALPNVRIDWKMVSNIQEEAEDG